MKFKKGQRVTGTFYGEVRTGTVHFDQVSSIVWVVWDDGDGYNEWAHAESLTLL